VNALAVAVRTETRKFRASRAALAASALFLGGLIALPLTFVAGARAGNAAILARLGDLAGGPLWEVHIGSAIQIAGAGGLFACGLVLSWSFGREFMEGTVSGLFALPVGRAHIAVAKVLVYLAWSVVLAVGVTAVVLVAGWVAGLGPVDLTVWPMLGRLCVLIVSSALIAIPAALFCTLGRGLLPGIGVIAVTVVVAQISVFGGAGPWVPLATPALWAIDPSSVPAAAWLLVPIVPIAGTSLTAFAWHRLQLDR
jgi:ABC-2 type transport system permease protein